MCVKVKRARADVCVHACACLFQHHHLQQHTPCLRSLLFFKPNIRTLEKMSTRLPLHSPCFLPGLLRLRWVVGRWACCSLACRFCRINPLAIAAAMSPPKKRNQSRLGPCLLPLQLCPPAGTERRQNQTQTSSLAAITAPYFSYNALKSRLNRLHHIFSYRYSIWLGAYSGLPVRHVPPVCLSDNSHCHCTPPLNDVTRAGVSVPGLMVKRKWRIKTFRMRN